ncbi:regulator protein [Ahrensia sp. R2A130]|nr:regulator protein [Ahrensia sp. R2A130]
MRVGSLVKANKRAGGDAKKARFWVGLGASAGGLEALRGLARNLPDDLPVTYIVAQHMAPHHKSMLAEIIGREATIDVQDVTDNLAPKPNTIYITPPNKNAIVKNNKIRLVDPSTEPGAPKPSIDTFLTSLAMAKKEFAIGVILSGTGSDGAKGISSIRAHGGITIAQDELTAKYSSMPVAAMEGGNIDLVMSPEEIGAQIPKITKLPRNLGALRASPLNLDATSELVQLLHDQTKVNFRHYKTATFQRRVERRMAATKNARLEDYVDIARHSPDEVQLLFKDLLISVTSFFRDPVEFDALKTHIAAIVAGKGKDHIRVWVPGTATGEEAYSIGMLFSEAMRENGAADNAKLQIFATDIDTHAIEIARRGFYPHSALDQVPPHLIRRYFDEVPSGYTVKKMLREKMVFSVHNIAQDPPFLKVDMISCRNLLIYFQASLQSEVFNRFHYALLPRGLLFLGKSEAVSASEALFSPADGDKHLFFQRPSKERRAPREMLYQRPAPINKAQQNVEMVPAVQLAQAEGRLEALIARLGTAAVLIDTKLNIVKSYGDFQRYVGVSSGMVDTKVTSLIREPFCRDLQASVPGVLRNQIVSEGFTQTVEGSEGTLREKVTIYPIETEHCEGPMALAVFKEWKEESVEIEPLDASPSAAALRKQVADLSSELVIAKTTLQQTVEELETSNEELQALNEEMQSSNEELQSTNEELETSNEELQSTNEELSTVNEELQVNAQQLSILNQSLSSILDNVTIPLLVVDRNLSITNASVVSEEFFGISHDLTLAHASRCRMRPGYPDLVDSLQAALDTGEPMEWHIRNKTQSATMKIVPHFSSSNELLGAIVLVVDNTSELMSARDELQLIFDTVPVGIMVRDRKGRVIRSNGQAAKLLGSTVEDLKKGVFADNFSKDSGAAIKRRDLEILETGDPKLSETSRYRLKNGQDIWARTSGIPAKHPTQNDTAIYAIVQDVTEQYEAEAALMQSELRLSQALKASRIGLWEEDLISGDVYLSERQSEILGVRSEGGRHYSRAMDAYIHPEDRKKVNRSRKQHLTSDHPFNETYRVKRGDGQYIWVKSYGQVVRDDEGTPIKLVGTMADVTADRDMLNSIRERKEQLELAAALSGVGYWKVDFKHDEVFWSEQVHVIHGTTHETYSPDLESALNFYHADDVSMVRDHLEATVERNAPFEMVARIIRADGKERIVRTIATLHKGDDGEAESLFGVFRDITEEKKKEVDLQSTLEELGRSNEELNRFSYVCSHDLKEPVRLIESMATLLIDPDFNVDETKQTEILKRIGSNTSRLKGIIDSLLAYSRIDARVELEDADLSKIMKDVLDGLALAIKEHNAVIEVADLPVIKGASVHFMQLFQNLIGNALKFSDKLKPVVKLSTSQTETGWLFVLEDNGPGIPADSRKDIFNLFSRLQRRDEVEGTGLGLSIAQRIVMQYGGTIECTDSALGGAAFHIYLPHKVSEDG